MRGVAIVAWLSTGCAAMLCEPVGSHFEPRHLSRSCPDDWELPEATCGLVTVPAWPDDPAACTLEVGVVSLPALAPDAASEPAVLLPGGPGQVVLHRVSELLPVVESWRQQRPVLLLDPRGGGVSRPALHCDDPALLRAFDKDPPTDLADALGRCTTWLAERGLSLDAFRVDRLADDVAHVLDALGHHRAHVIGGSFGTRWAQALVRRHPSRVASLLLDAPGPADVSLYELGPARFVEVLDLVFAGCGADPECAAMLPAPWDTVWALVADWDATPRVVAVGDQAVPLDGAAFLSLLHEAVKSSRLLPAVPALVHESASDRLEALAALLQRKSSDGVIALLHHAVQCADGFPFASAARAAAAQDPRFTTWDAYGQQVPICAALGVTPSPASVRMVPDVGVPALLLTGLYDPQEPVTWVDALAGPWSARRWVAADASHGVLPSDCGRELAGVWLRDPSAFTPPACMDRAGVDWHADTSVITALSTP